MTRVGPTWLILGSFRGEGHHQSRNTRTSGRRGLTGAGITKGGEVSAKRGLAGAENAGNTCRMPYTCSCCHTVDRKLSPLHPPLGSHQCVSLARSNSSQLEREPENRAKENTNPSIRSRV